MKQLIRSFFVAGFIAALGAVPAHSQLQVGFALDAGPLFAGASFGLGSHHYDDPFYSGISFGILHHSHYARHYDVHVAADAYSRPRSPAICHLRSPPPRAFLFVAGSASKR